MTSARPCCNPHPRPTSEPLSLGTVDDLGQNQAHAGPACPPPNDPMICARGHVLTPSLYLLTAHFRGLAAWRSFLWQIASAHRGSVSAVDMNALYLLTGGKDGSVRVWSDQPSRQLVGNFDEHKKRVTSLCVDLQDPSKIHSCSEDKTVVTIDLQSARRTHCHSVKEGMLTSMCQATTNELELITADTSGNLKWWDCDEAEPVSMLVTWSPQDDPNKERRLTHVTLSPPLEGGSRYGSEYLLACTASGDVQVC